MEQAANIAEVIIKNIIILARCICTTLHRMVYPHSNMSQQNTLQNLPFLYITGTISKVPYERNHDLSTTCLSVRFREALAIFLLVGPFMHFAHHVSTW